MIETLPNIGILNEMIPDYLFVKLQKEGEMAERSYREPWRSGVSSYNTPEHYHLDAAVEDLLKKYIMTLSTEYLSVFPSYLHSINYSTANNGLIVKKPWLNVQRKGEYVPLHQHDGVFSYVIWIKIPYDLEKELSGSEVSDNFNCAFEFVYTSILGYMSQYRIWPEKKDQGRIIFFPAKLKHSVYPFYKSEEARISISGNVSFV